ncbi:MAG: major facilitator transporter, partial [Deltaproteobacteria bacterium]|nr:major facilitator transporter [Deltaproteobacteria bacterium]
GSDAGRDYVGGNSLRVRQRHCRAHDELAGNRLRTAQLLCGFHHFVFPVASFFCGNASTLWQLVLFRFLQGVSGGALLSTSQSILIETFPPAADSLRSDQVTQAERRRPGQ